MKEKPFYVECKYAAGWADAEWTEDDEPLRFATKQEAESAIDEFIRDATEAGLDYSREDYAVADLRWLDRPEPSDLDPLPGSLLP